MADLEVSLGADPSELGRDLSRAQNMITNFVNQVERIGEIGEKLSAIGRTLTASITLPIIGLGAASIKAYGDIEALQKGLEAVMGSASLASSEFDKLREVAKLPGLGLKEAVKGSVALQSAGFSAQKSREALLAFGNALATVGKGANEMNFVILALTQLQNKATGFGQDLRQLMEQLPQLRGALKEAFGTSDSEEIANTGATGAQVVEKLVQEFAKLPKVTGGIKNAFENLKDSIFINLSRIGDVINKHLNITAVVDKLTSLMDQVISAFENLDPTIQKSILVVAGLVAAIGPLIASVGLIMQSIPTLTAGVGALSSAFTFLTGPIGLVTVGIIGIVAAVIANWDKIRPYIEETIDRFKRLYNESEAFRAIIGSIGFAFEVLARIAFEALKGIYQNVKTIGKGILEIWSGLGDVLEGAFTGNINLLKTGIGKAGTALSDTASNALVNNIDVLKKIGTAIDVTEKKWSNLRFDTSKKTDLSFNGSLESSVEKEVSSGVKKGLDKAKINLPENILPAIEPVKTQIKGLIDALGNYHDTVASLFSSEAQRDLMVNATVLPTILDQQYLSVLKAKERMSEVVGSFNQNVSELLNREITDTIVNAMSALGNAFATGGNAIEAIGLSLLSSIGNILVELGKQLIGAGVALIAIKVALKSLNPYVALAAGAALVALGSFVSGNVSKIGSSMGSGGGGGSVSTGTGANYSGSTYSSNYSSGGGYGGGGEVVFRLSGYELKGVLDRVNGKNDRLNAGN